MEGLPACRQSASAIATIAPTPRTDRSCTLALAVPECQIAGCQAASQPNVSLECYCTTDFAQRQPVVMQSRDHPREPLGPCQLPCRSHLVVRQHALAPVGQEFVLDERACFLAELTDGSLDASGVVGVECREQGRLRLVPAVASALARQLRQMLLRFLRPLR